MESVLRAFVIYIFILVLFRMSGKRSMAQVTPFDMVLILIISEATQNAMVGQDYSMTNAIVLITTLISLDIGLSLIKHRSRAISRILDDVPVVILRDGKMLASPADRERVDEEDVLQAARCSHGIDRLEDIEAAVLETDGQISVIPRRGAA